MKFLPVLESGDPLTTSEGLERTVWKTVLLYVDTEGQIHEDEKPKVCEKAFAHDQLSASGWELCFSCGVELKAFRAFTSDSIRP